ncbi:MAG: hypothetical protein K0Q49_1982 [Haloplasmataceae bacterium]|jgi:uncharacterized YccA/Bax inhibitor family protein|nr:hypothetical protein [Haloplasmataceae bacterium]
MFETRNPVLNDIKSGDSEYSRSYVTGETASFTGIAFKSAFLLGIVFVVASIIWMNIDALADKLMGLLIVSSIVTFVSVIVGSVSLKRSPIFSVIYAIFEGITLGSISVVVQLAVGKGDINATSIVANAVSITFAIFLFLLVCYSTGIFKVGNKFRNIVYTAMFGLLFFYLFNFILGFFQINLLGGLGQSGMLVFSILIILLASFSLLIDFDDCKRAVDNQLSKKYEWQLSLGLIVTLVWLYIEVLRLLLILANRRD